MLAWDSSCREKMKPVEKNAFEMEKFRHDGEQRTRLRHSYALMTTRRRVLVLFHAEQLKKY